MKVSVFLLLLAFSMSAMASCHEKVAHKIQSLAQDAVANQKLTSSDLNWINDTLEVAVARSEGNNFSCSHYNVKAKEYMTSVSSILLNRNDIPRNVKTLLENNTKLLTSLVAGEN